MKGIYTIIISISLTFNLIFDPVLLFASQDTVLVFKACQEGQKDASRIVNKKFWFIYGLAFNVTAFLAANMVDPPPPPSDKLMGKTPEYTSSYLKCYEEKARDIQNTESFKGILINGTVWLIATWILFYLEIKNIKFDLTIY